MPISIVPYEGIDSARLGMTREDIRRAIQGDVEPYKKVGVVETDYFIGKSIHAYFDDQGFCKAFEIYSPASIALFGNELLGKPFREVLNLLRDLDENIEMISAGARSLKLGISLYAPFADGLPEELIEGVLVFRRGYWDEPVSPLLKAKFERIRNSLKERLKSNNSLGSQRNGADPRTPPPAPGSGAPEIY